MTTKFGWCLDGHHETCILKISDYTCICECHGALLESKDDPSQI